MAPAEPAGGAAADPAADGAGADGLTVEVVCALAPRQWLRAEVRLPAGATAVQALKASGLSAQLPEGLLDRLTLGLWGRACAPEVLLHDGDRVELTRPLTVDPKEARRLRYRRDGLKRPTRGAAR
jgi:putative ubiquitin-RnfH superfamily antitoxin RatB of RatAB toxin-antitoxin module